MECASTGYKKIEVKRTLVWNTSGVRKIKVPIGRSEKMELLYFKEEKI
jgi:hypothetical protein